MIRLPLVRAIISASKCTVNKSHYTTASTFSEAIMKIKAIGQKLGDPTPDLVVKTADANSTQSTDPEPISIPRPDVKIKKKVLTADELAEEFRLSIEEKRPINIGLSDIPGPPRKPRKAIDLYHADKNFTRIMEDPTATPYSRQTSTLEWQLETNEFRSKYTEKASQELLNYKQAVDDYNKILDLKLTVGQMIELIRNSRVSVANKTSRTVVNELTGVESKSDPTKKRPISGYNLFLREMRDNPSIKKDEFLTYTSALWKNMTKFEKEAYKRRAEEAFKNEQKE